MSSITSLSPLATSTAAPVAGRDWTDLGQADFIKLLTVQMQQQDPFDPVDNKEMLAQMAQFSSLAGTTEMGDTLKAIEAKLDTLSQALTASSQEN
ncbi:flagellar biosynthesis protein FlgD [Porphyrobacter algicida]|uniref:Basal-body rod modification protein FlgD n=1 Tax=Qipengyuania algicida TaxID=1836209 RepID=A0A845AEH9_9SPHN|nr:flagellar hook capping FlgD N-terminal domain-containing protein [Qipengyuania algicida]MXP27623.1 flagellar biosynthesis protein FlgD [Qipengyuania algicida]